MLLHDSIPTLPVDVEEEDVSNARYTFTWLAARHCEISLFRHFQDVVNCSEPLGSQDQRANATGFLVTLITLRNTCAQLNDQIDVSFTMLRFRNFELTTPGI